MKKVKRILSVVLCLAMVLCAVPVMEASAATTVQITQAGQIVDTFNGVSAIYRTGLSDNSDATYSCAAFVKRYYNSVYGVDVWNLLTGKTPAAGSGSFSQTSSPESGDIGYQTNSSGNGHWFIIKSVSGSTYTIIEQNWKWQSGSNYYCTKERQVSTSTNGFKAFRWSEKGGTSPTPSGHSPTVALDHLSGGAGVLNLSGWAFDEDDYSAQLSIHVYIGGGDSREGYGWIIANKERPDVNSVHGCGNNHGFSETIETNLSGDQWVTVWAISVGGGDNTLLYDNLVHIDPAPQFHFDLNGWLDGQLVGDLGAYGRADVYINGQLAANDVDDFHGWFPRGTTYEIKDIKAKTGYTYNGVKEGSLSGTLNENKSVVLNFSKGVVPNGCLDGATGGAGNVTIAGWAFDYDAPSTSIDIHAYLADSSGNETWLGSTKADIYRGDVFVNGIAGNHGFNAKLYTKLTGTYTVRVYAINVGGGSGNPLIGYRTVTISNCTNHAWNSGTVTKAATCTTAGTKTFTCSNCGTTKTEAIAALGHSYGAWTRLDDTQHQRVCSRDSSHVEKANHTWNSGTITQAATCSATGVKTYTCSVCNGTKTETVAINSSNHAHTTDVAETASTCTVKGYTAGVYCNDCKKYISGHQEQPLAAHQTETRNARAATCSAEGYTGDQYCTVCKQTISTGTTIGKKAHTLTTINQKNADCTTAGYTGDQYCTVCKQTISTGTTIGKKAHTLTTINKKDAGCTTAGYTGDQYCTVCKQTISTGTTIGKTAHTLTTINQKNANCTEKGYTGDQYCTTCKQTITKGSATAALGHTSPDGNGNCTRCGKHIKDVTPTQPSQPQTNPNVCKWCGKVHNGNFFDRIVGFFHSVLAIFKR